MKKCFNRVSLFLVITLGASFSQGFAAAPAPGTPSSAAYRAVWMQEARWGVMCHYLSDWLVRNEKLQPMTADNWNALIDNFNVEGLADQLQLIGARYLIFTIGQNSGYYVSPNPVYDQYTGIIPSKCARRDLIADISKAVKKRGIRMIVYLPSGAPAGDAKARETLQWQNGPYPNIEFQEKWEKIIAYWAAQWGESIDGWWFDGCYWPNSMYRNELAPNFRSFAAAARTGNPRCAVAFNPGILYRTISVTPFEDYIGGEINMPELMNLRTQDGLADGAQLQILTYMGETWGTGAPRYSAEEVIGHSIYVIDHRGAITWDVPIRSDGLLDSRYVETLHMVGKTLNSYEPSPETLANPKRRNLIPTWPRGVPYQRE